ncbi:hypothetical protein T10_12048 [Trichinella papuae]|uniref:Uncharacterized protein n=1 Tax=Trichinella papuae TaxID=268474 RepID=A0A0V1MQX7_9BILA|nr:hypothetical protein T10_12048 [Trichinella papuae]
MSHRCELAKPVLMDVTDSPVINPRCDKDEPTKDSALQPALQAVEDLTITLENYSAIVKLLHDQFCRISAVLDSHITQADCTDYGPTNDSQDTETTTSNRRSPTLKGRPQNETARMEITSFSYDKTTGQRFRVKESFQKQEKDYSCSDPKPQKENCLAAKVYDSLRHVASFTVKAKMLFQSLWTLGLTLHLPLPSEVADQLQNCWMAVESNDRNVMVNLMITRSQVASIKNLETGIDGEIAMRQIGKIHKKGDYPAYPRNIVDETAWWCFVGLGWGLQAPKTLCSKLNGRDKKEYHLSVGDNVPQNRIQRICSVENAHKIN